ncbi:hypothetical protein [Rhizohabitans arisaemae]|uniref:hypothetical protein n=1 Tax=Rhizohabitans arisaemae TaxID=2720610 RepID=UPI0024B09DBA|nr:hypothetical protein [Rhizohabitans arisaemae]
MTTVGLAAALVAVSLTPTAALALDDPGQRRGGDCSGLFPEGTPDHVVCRYLVGSDQEALDIAKYWMTPGRVDSAKPWPLDEMCAADDTCGPPRPESTPTGAPGSVDPDPGDHPENDQAQQTANGATVDQTVDQAAALGLRVWVEDELADDWLAGPERFRAAVTRLAGHANRPGVAGIKFSYDLGNRPEFKSPDEVQRFVADTSAALRTAAPGKRLAVDAVVPELGCGAVQACLDALRAKYPLLTAENAERYLLTGAVDAVTLNSVPFAGEYGAFGLSATQAQFNQWVTVKSRGWDARVHVGARDAGLTQDGSEGWDTTRAEAEARFRLDLPLQSGAQTVLVSASRQGSDAQVFGDGLTENEVTKALRARKQLRRTALQIDPAKFERGVAADLQAAASVADEVYVFAGYAK